MKTTGVITHDGNNDKESIVNTVTIHDEVSKTKASSMASEFVITIQLTIILATFEACIQ